MKYFIVTVLFFLLFVNCKNKEADALKELKLSKIEIVENTFNFGNINKNDTVNHFFVIRNISDKKYIIDTVGTSCGCTTTSYTRDSISKNKIAKINVQFIPNEDDSGKISKSIVVSDNSESGYHAFYLKGKVVE